ncbi:hypothetical protein [Halarcobacter ebronensis]|uniref:Uncharacterized protein n=1 Tax=Halarcobacter ebronensis TaxID=1462615 RepID=A0A4Q1ASU4_9BACT|nr:hypothetical protein [Halarcobacter ebronensis]QKF82799.1 putative membrane protein [Halarcobacter ebronensis]RXK06823.1 hypothetical protein CRV07_05165 [Halarcobacter ebronensis]
MLLTPEVLTIIIINSIFLIFGTVAFLLSIKIFFNWDINSTSKLQYSLENQSYLTATIIKYILFLKILIFIFFIFTLDKISNVLTGAMCAAGVVDATSYGIYLLLFKLINIYFFGFWLVIHNIDMKTKELKFTKLKFGFYLFIYLIFLVETIIEITMFGSIEVDKLVSCCGTLYSNSSGSYISSLFAFDNSYILIVFYTIFALLVLSYFIKNDYLYTIFNLLFLIISLISLIMFFGTYIYELPTHHCPFCMLQKGYYYIGYIIYITLFLGTFFGFIITLKNIILQDRDSSNKYYNYSIIFSFVYVIIVSLYPLSFYIRNGVFL